MQEAIGYSLWFVPPRPFLGDFRSHIQRYSSKYGVPYFEPHVTLAGGIGHILSLDTIIKETEALTQELGTLKPLELAFGPAASGEEFTRCVFFKIALTESLGRARELSYAHFPCDWYATPDAFVPHLSIVYGNLPFPTRAETVRELNRSCVKGSFIPQEISLWRTQGTPDQWRHVESFLLP